MRRANERTAIERAAIELTGIELTGIERTAVERTADRRGRGFGRLLHAEWTKFRTVRGFVLGMTAAVLTTVLLGVVVAAGSQESCGAGPGQSCAPTRMVGPDGGAVTDKFYLVHRPLTGDGSITARVTALTGIITYPRSSSGAIVDGVEPWTKAGVIIKDGTGQGSPYAAVMVTGEHGVRMQDNYTHDTAGTAGAVTAAAPRWLRLTRAGDLVTGYESGDGTRWDAVGTATLRGLPATVQVGLFVASPFDVQIQQGPGSGSAAHFTQASGVFDEVGLRGTTGGAWRGDAIGGAAHTDWDRHHRPAGYAESGGSVTVVADAGDIAPALDAGSSVGRTLLGTVAGLLAVVVVATLFITGEYRRGLIRTSLTACPRRGTVLAAKAAVIGTVAFVAGMVGAALAMPLAGHILRANGAPADPVGVSTVLRLIVGTGALLAAAAVLALALGTVTRRGAVTVAVLIATIVLPYVLAVGAGLPASVQQWLLRVTPAAGFAIQQTLIQYAQVTGPYTPSNGYLPLAPWAGLAVLCGYAAVALALATRLLRRRDA